MFGFPKSAKDNIRTDELKGLKALAQDMLSYDAKALEKAVVKNRDNRGGLR